MPHLSAGEGERGAGSPSPPPLQTAANVIGGCRSTCNDGERHDAELKTGLMLQSIWSTSETVASAMSCGPQQFDFIVIGCGSGGSACADRALSYSAKVCLIECGSSPPHPQRCRRSTNTFSRFSYADGVRKGAGHGGTCAVQRPFPIHSPA
jgi:hypothetical protein